MWGEAHTKPLKPRCDVSLTGAECVPLIFLCLHKIEKRKFDTKKQSTGACHRFKTPPVHRCGLWWARVTAASLSRAIESHGPFTVTVDSIQLSWWTGCQHFFFF